MRSSSGTVVLLIGGGGREHALAWKLAQSPGCGEIICAPGNPGIATVPKVRIAPSVRADGAAGEGGQHGQRGQREMEAIVDLARAEAVDLVVCGPEGPLATGLGDRVRAAGIPFFGPSRAAAEIEGSKAFAKRLMADAGVPTAAFGVFDDVASAERFIDAQPGPVVVKADGLCAGKGVVVAETKAESRAAVRRMIGERAFGSAGARVVLEERLFGREVSLMAICDGERLALLPSAEDHKAVFDGDRGPNTGGMGTCSPSPVLTESLTALAVTRIFEPTLRAMRALGRPFSGVLYGGLMLTADRGPMVIEWNCRFGDPETQVVLPRLADDLLPWLQGAAAGRLPPGALQTLPGAAVCVVLAAQDYPGAPRVGDVIHGLPAHATETADGALVFHAGTGSAGAGGASSGGGGEVGERVVTAGGRVLGITTRRGDIVAARAAAYAAIGTGVGQIGFAGMHFRTDIGARRETT
jgi:phosphoribosylamine---glycine ligase